jgi:hypothetical protein
LLALRLIRTAIRQGEAQALPLLEASGSGSAQAKKRRRKAQQEAAMSEATALLEMFGEHNFWS